MRSWLIVGLVAVGGNEVLGMMVSRSAEITGCINLCNTCESRCDEVLVDCFGLVAIGGNEVLGRLIGMASMSWFGTGRQVVYCRPVRQLPGQKAEV